MNRKCLTIVLLAVIAIMSGCMSGPTGPTATSTLTPVPTPVSSAHISPVTPAPTSTPATVTATVIKCEICHTNPENLTPHLNGGKYCINCHGSQVHNIHTGAGTVNLDCVTCHGMPPKIPTVAKGTGPGHYIVCENCHAPPPNNLNPSNGNLIVIHLSRGKYCTNCHGNDIGVIHSRAIANANGNVTIPVGPVSVVPTTATPTASPTANNTNTTG